VLTGHPRRARYHTTDENSPLTLTVWTGIPQARVRAAQGSSHARGGKHRGGRPMVSRHGDRTRRHGAPLRVVRLRRLVGCCSLGLVLLYAVWSLYSAALLGWYGPPSVQAQDRPAASDVRQRQVAFLHRLRQADPRYQTIEKAVFNEKKELGD